MYGFARPVPRQNSAPPRTPTAPLPPPPTPGAPCLRPGGRWGDRTGRNRIMRIEPDRHPGRVGPARTPGSILITLPRPVLRAGGPGSRARGERGRAFTISLLPQSNKFKTIRCFGMCCQPSGKVGDRFGSILGPFWADSGHPGAVPGRSGSILGSLSDQFRSSWGGGSPPSWCNMLLISRLALRKPGIGSRKTPRCFQTDPRPSRKVKHKG